MPTLESFVALDVAEQRERGLVFTPREIAQQPRTWRGTVEIFLREQTRVQRFLEQAGVRGAVAERPVVMLVGAGTSDYIGQALMAVLQRMWGCEVFACASTTLLTNADDYVVPERAHLWISFSRSGDSPEGVAVLEMAAERYPEIAQMVVTCNAEARMIEVAERAAAHCVLVLDDAVNDRSLAMTSSFTNMVVMGHCLAHAWAMDAYVGVARELEAAGEDLLRTMPAVAERVASIGVKRVCLLGSGPLESVAKEAALKILEMTAGRIKTMAETVLGLRHGPMAALDADTLFVCFVSTNERRARYAKDVLLEVGAKGIVRERVAVGPVGMRPMLDGACEVFVPVRDGIDDVYRPVLDVMVGQLLGLYCSVGHGLKPDAPSPGEVISRVVRRFQIH